MTAPSKDSDQPGHPPSLIGVFPVRMKKAWVLSYPLSAQRRLWSDWADAQADRSLRWVHSHFVGFVMWRLNCQTRIIVKIVVSGKALRACSADYRNDPKLSDRHVWANSVDPDQQSDQDLHCLPLTVWLHLLGALLFGKITLFKFKDNYSNFFCRGSKCFGSFLWYYPKFILMLLSLMFCFQNVIWAATRQDQQNDMCAQRRLSLGISPVFMQTAKTLIRLGGCPGWSEASLGTQVILLVLSCGGSYSE